jgi:O-antigen/teichoic acid export membrane protein
MKNSFWNFLGRALPVLMGVLTFPFLVRAMGTERFGALLIIWTIINYFTLFDFGLGRALTRIVAARLGKKETSDIPSLFWTGFLPLFVLGIFAALALFVSASWLGSKVIELQNPLQKEIVAALRLFAAGLPILISGSALRAMLDAYELFPAKNSVDIAANLLAQMAPLVVTYFDTRLTLVVASILAANLLRWIGYLILCNFTVENLWLKRGISVGESRSLFVFGGWQTVINLVRPMLYCLDRFIIASVISATAVAYYVTPFEAITKLWIIPNSLTNALFPALSRAYLEPRSQAAQILRSGNQILLVVLYPCVLFCVTFAPEIMSLWLGSDFCQKSALPFQVLAIGVLINSLVLLPAESMMALGKPEIVGKLCLIELPFHGIITWYMVIYYGIVGAAIAWTGRAILDALCVFMLVRAVDPRSVPAGAPLFSLVLGCIITLMVPLALDNLSIRILFFALCAASFVGVFWFLIMNSYERTALLDLVPRIRDAA